MTPAALARADQIIAVLREQAPDAVHTFDLYQLLGPSAVNGWGLVSTVALLNEMYASDRIDVPTPACCALHSLWCLPADV